MNELISNYKTILKYLNEYPSQFSFNENGIGNLASDFFDRFYTSRKEKKYSRATTVPDHSVSLVLHHYFDTPQENLERIKIEHQDSMIAENIVGEILEKYLAYKLEPLGWIWCSGEFIVGTDFIKKDENQWIELQIKNRSNTENSSSNKIRTGTQIEKWYRIDAYTAETFWKTFPNVVEIGLLSEEDFHQFLESYLQRIKNLEEVPQKTFNIYPLFIDDEDIDNIKVHQNDSSLLQYFDEEEIRNAIIYRFKRKKHFTEYRKNIPSLSLVPNIKKSIKNVNKPISSLVNNEISLNGNNFERGQVLFLKYIIEDNNIPICTIYPCINQDKNKFINLLIDDVDIKYYMFSNTEIMLQSDLNYTKTSNLKINNLEMEYYKVSK